MTERDLDRIEQAVIVPPPMRYRITQPIMASVALAIASFKEQGRN